MTFTDEERECLVEALDATMRRLKPSLKSESKGFKPEARQFYLAKELRARILSAY